MNADARLIEDLMGGFTHDELEAAFTKVASTTHWKAPIDWTGPLTPAEMAVTMFAIPFFTATAPRITMVRRGIYHVTAPGYWAGPAN